MGSSREEKCLAEWLTARLAAPDARTSVLSDSRASLSYPEAAACVATLKFALRREGLGPEDCAALEAENSLAGALMLLALLAEGVDLVPLPAPGLEARAATGEPPLPAFVRWRILVGADGAWRMEASPAYRPAARAAMLRRRRETLWFWKTSGSLGIPKLVQQRQSLGVANALDAGRALGLTSGDRVALPIPIFHKFGGGIVLSCLAAGASIDFQHRSNLMRYLEREAASAPDVAFLGPALAEALTRRRRPRRYRQMIVGGDRISETTASRLESLHGPVVVAYGNSEFGSIAFGALHQAPERRQAGVMVPMASYEWRIEPPDDRGELAIRCDTGFDGYVDVEGVPLVHPGLDADGWFRTGDLAERDGDGLRVLGRCDLSINRCGLLLPLADVEARARDIEGVLEAVAMAGGESLRGRTLVLYCVVVPGCALDAADIRRACEQRLPPYAVPDAVHVLGEMPLLPSGKVDRRAIGAL